MGQQRPPATPKLTSTPAGADPFPQLGAMVISFEIVSTCFLDALCKTQPATARAVVVALQRAIQTVDPQVFPGVRTLLQKYIRMVQKTLAHPPT